MADLSSRDSTETTQVIGRSLRDSIRTNIRIVYRFLRALAITSKSK